MTYEDLLAKCSQEFAMQAHAEARQSGNNAIDPEDMIYTIVNSNMPKDYVDLFNTVLSCPSLASRPIHYDKWLKVTVNNVVHETVAEALEHDLRELWAMQLKPAIDIHVKHHDNAPHNAHCGEHILCEACECQREPSTYMAITWNDTDGHASFPLIEARSCQEARALLAKSEPWGQYQFVMLLTDDTMSMLSAMLFSSSPKHDISYMH